MNGKPDGAGGAGQESTFRQTARAGLRSRAPFAALWVASVLLPLLVLGLAAAWSWYGVESEARARVQRMVDMMHEHVLRSLDTQEAILEAIDYGMDQSDWESIAGSRRLHVLLATLNRRSPPSGGIVLVSPDREIVAGSAEFPFTPIDASDRDYTRPEAHRDERVYIGETVVARPRGQRVFPVSRARSRAAEAGGWIVASFAPDYFEDFYRAVRESDEDAAALVRSDGAVLARIPSGDEASEAGERRESWRLPSDEIVAAALAENPDQGLIDTVSAHDGNRRLYAYRRVSGYPLYVVYGMSRQTMRAAWLRELVAHAGIAWIAAMALLVLTARIQSAARRERVALADARFEAERRAEAEQRLAHMQRVDALGRIVGGVAHDFKNIVQAMRGGASRVAKRADDPDEVRRIASMIDASAERGARLIERMLAFARRDQMPTAHFDIAAALAEIRDLLERTIGPAHRLACETEPDLPQVAGDRAEFETALVNLVLNARDAMPDGGPIRISAQREAPDEAAAENPGAAARIIAITVTDAGAGMDDATLARAGEPFFTTKPAGEGTGLGLATARAFAEHVGGTLEIASVAGAGARITLRLPVA
jgi:two-component system NtrC family sensor kinase